MVTVTLRPNTAGTYNQFVEVANSGFLFGDQLESNDFTLWTTTGTGAGATLTIQNTIKHNGSYAAQSSVTLQWDYATFDKRFGSSYATSHFRAYVRFTNTPNTNQRFQLAPRITDTVDGYELATLWLYNNNGTLNWDLIYKTDAAENNHAYSTTPTISTNTWYCIEVGMNGATNTGWVKAWIVADGGSIAEGSPTISITSLTNDNTLPDRFELGLYIENDRIVTAYYDCAVISTAYIGVEVRYHLVHDSSDNTSLQVTTSTTQKETENLEDSADLGTINSVTAYARAKYATGTGDEHIKIIWRLAATEVLSAESAHLTNAFADYTDVRNTDPDGAAWTWVHINSLEVGAMATTLGAGEVLQFSEFYIVVDYTVAGVTMPLFTHHLSSMNRAHQSD